MQSEADRMICCVTLCLLALFLLALPGAAHSQDVNPRLNKAEQVFREGKEAHAFKMVNTVIQESPDTAEAYFTLGTFYEAQGNDAEAKQAYRTYMQKRGGKLPTDVGVLLRLRRHGLY